MVGERKYCNCFCHWSELNASLALRVSRGYKEEEQLQEDQFGQWTTRHFKAVLP